MSKRPDYRWSVITIIWLSSVISIWTLFSGAATAQRAVPSIRDIVAFEVDPVQPRQRPGVSDFDVSLDDLEQVLTTYQVVTEARWRADYHHVAFSDRTGTLSIWGSPTSGRPWPRPDVLIAELVDLRLPAHEPGRAVGG